MSEIDFQNGFVCGMATKGLTVVGKEYEPIVWNDAGVYTHFYIDFKRSLLPFSTGMLSESIVVHDSVQLMVTKVTLVSPGVYKIYCDIAGKVNGITVINKATSYLKYNDGSKLPPFSVHFFVAGIVPYIKSDYMYDATVLPMMLKSCGETSTEILWESSELGLFYESTNCVKSSFSAITDNFTLVLT